MFVAERSHELCRRALIVQTITLLHTVFQESFTTNSAGVQMSSHRPCKKLWRRGEQIHGWCQNRCNNCHFMGHYLLFWGDMLLFLIKDMSGAICSQGMLTFKEWCSCSSQGARRLALSGSVKFVTSQLGDYNMRPLGAANSSQPQLVRLCNGAGSMVARSV